MNLIFTILSIAYIFSIFFWADSPVVSDLAAFNPYSLLHIPLYGILTTLLVFSVLPLNLTRAHRTNERNPIDQRDQRTERNGIYRKSHFLIPGVIALGVAIADEVYQSFLPSRDASVIDIFLDFIGISLGLFLIFRLYKKQKTRETQ